MPKTATEALEINRKEGNNFWQETIMKEMRYVIVAFEIFEEEKEDISK